MGKIYKLLVVHKRGIELKRTPEFVLGLIGGILGIIISIILIVVAFNIMEGVDYELFSLLLYYFNGSNRIVHFIVFSKQG